MKNMINHLFGKLSLFLICILSYNGIVSGKELPLIPNPNSVVVKNDSTFKLAQGMSIGVLDPNLEPSAKALQAMIKKRTGLELPVQANDTASILLIVDPALRGKEHYQLEIGANGIEFRGSDPEAVFRGVTTLDQVLMEASARDAALDIQAVMIDDAPRYPYRALMLDPARNFLPVEDVKSFIDHMARYKYNVLQMHLSDDQGWRVQIDSYPELNSEKAYSKDDIKDIISYAAERYINVVPEIDIPGHTSAFLSVFPDLGCDNHKNEEIIVGKTDNRMLCASNPEVYNVFEGVLKEISDLFPYDYIHLGGDEAAIPRNWALCESCLAYMAENGYSEPSQLMIPFFDKMLGFVRANGKKPILWCELNNIYPPADDYLFPYPDDVTLVTWRAGLTPTCLALTEESGHPLIMAPGEYAYLDYPQMKGDLPEFNNWGMPVTTLSKTYQFDPGYGSAPEKEKHVMGVMGTLWGEAIKDINRVNYMAFPRALALSEAGWTNMDNRDWESFKERLYPNLTELMKDGVSFRVPFEIANQ